ICVCYNHEAFVKEAMESVFRQDYPHLEIIAIDDASTDQSATILEQLAAGNRPVTVLRNRENLGLCKSFNKALAIAKGEFIIDFATDDVMMPDRIRRQVEYFSNLDSTYGVVFTDALYVDERGAAIREHYEYLKRKKLLN